MTILSITALMALLIAPLALAKEPAPLFNGKGLTGWTATAHPRLWTVENGEIVGRWDVGTLGQAGQAKGTQLSFS